MDNRGIRQGLRFNPSNMPTVNIKNGDYFNFERFTIDFWVFHSDIKKEFNGGIALGDIFSSIALYAYKIDFHNGSINFSVSSGSDYVSISRTLLEGWNKYTASYDRSFLRLFSNGVLLSETPSYLYLQHKSNLSFGGRNSGLYSLFGCMTDVRIYNRALSASEVAANYNGNVTRNGLVGEWLFNEGYGNIAHDTSGNGNHGTITGATWIIKGVRMKPRKNLLQGEVEQDDIAWNQGNGGTAYPNKWIDGKLSVYNGSGAVNGRGQDVNVKVGVPLTLSCKLGENGTQRVRVFSGSSGIALEYVNFTSSVGMSSMSATFVPTTPKINVRFANFGDNSPSNPSLFWHIQLEQGTVATPWEPYELVPDVKAVRMRPKFNLLQDFTKWARHANAVVNPNDPYELTLNASAPFQISKMDLVVFPNTQYTLNVSTNSDRFVAVAINANGDDLNGGVPLAHVNAGIPVTFMTTKDTVKLSVRAYSSVTGTFTFSNPCLALGTDATFEPYELIPDLKPAT